MRALVTGGAGYIGAAVVALLLDAGHDVAVIDDLSTGSADAVPQGAALHRCSIADAPAVAKVLQGFRADACFHFAGRIAAGESMQLPAAYFRANVADTLSLLDTLVAGGVDRVVFSSSAAVYGDPQSVPIAEDHPLAPVSVYGESKLLVERALEWLERLGVLRFAALRYFNAAGAHRGVPERHRPETHLIPLALDAAASGRDFELFGDDYPTRDGTCVRDYVHVSDLAEAHLLAVEALGAERRVVCNLGTGTGATNAEVLGIVQEVTGLELRVVRVDRRPGDPAELVAGNALARRVLGWSPRASLREVVRDAWAARAKGS